MPCFNVFLASQRTTQINKLIKYSCRLNSYCFYSSKKGAYSESVKTIKTDFPLSLKNSLICDRELEIQEKCQFNKLYEWQSSQDRTKTFVFHDGPPYANGLPHVGHALNKILKDITNRYKLLRGHKIHYVPGWDCHGTPIEQKALAKVAHHQTLNALEIRKVAGIFALEAAEHQKAAFKRWGIMADWDNGCYYTNDPLYEADELEAFYSMYEKGLIYQQYMPVFWSPTSKSAIAEAEIEYKEDYESIQAYIKFPLVKLPPHCSKHELPDKIYAVIWTTTPWTLPFNKAICYCEGMRYCILKDSHTNEAYLVSERFKDEFCSLVSSNLHKIADFSGSELSSCTYTSMEGLEAPFLPANHVTIDKGTGLVHTAPAHGVEDFQVALKHNLSVECKVDNEGRFEGGENLQGKFVLTDGNEEVLRQFSESVIHRSTLKHSYPLDWRTKQPIIIKASLQWFVDANKIKQLAVDCMKKLPVFPSKHDKGTASASSSTSNRGMMVQLEKKSYWCISRQRVWGVPIPVFVEKKTGKNLISRASVDHLKKLISIHGSDCWWNLPLHQLLPENVIKQSGFDEGSIFEKGKDILDIWFDSGVSWRHVLKDCKETVADVYLEGLDQFGGWFMTSLLTSVALQQTAPFKNLVVHGFALDEEGRKMSKSVGNVVEPNVVIEGGTDTPPYGVDVLRMWAAHAGLDVGVTIGPKVLDDLHQKLFRFRRSLRYMMGFLDDYDTFDLNLSVEQLQNLHINDRYMLHLLQDLVTRVTLAYESFNYSRVLRLLDWFNSSQVSAFYFHIVKDRLYCGQKDDVLSSQTVMFQILNVFAKLLAPIVPHLAEEVYMYHPMKCVNSSVFKTVDWLPSQWSDQSLDSLYGSFQQIKDSMNSMLGTKRPGDFDLDIICEGQLFNNLKYLHGSNSGPSYTSPLTELLLTADVSVASSYSTLSSDVELKQEFYVSEEKYGLILKKAAGKKCLRCRRNVAVQGCELCSRCTDVLKKR